MAVGMDMQRQRRGQTWEQRGGVSTTWLPGGHGEEGQGDAEESSDS